MLCMLKHTPFSCVYAKDVFSIHKITKASNCNKHLGCFVLFPGFSSHRTREYIKNNTRLQGRQPPEHYTHPPLPARGSWERCKVPQSVADPGFLERGVASGRRPRWVGEGGVFPSLGWGLGRGSAPSEKYFEIYCAFLCLLSSNPTYANIMFIG